MLKKHQFREHVPTDQHLLGVHEQLPGLTEADFLLILFLQVCLQIIDELREVSLELEGCDSHRVVVEDVPAILVDFKLGTPPVVKLRLVG